MHVSAHGDEDDDDVFREMRDCVLKFVIEKQSPASSCFCPDNVSHLFFPLITYWICGFGKSWRRMDQRRASHFGMSMT